MEVWAVQQMLDFCGKFIVIVVPSSRSFVSLGSDYCWVVIYIYIYYYSS